MISLLLQNPSRKWRTIAVMVWSSDSCQLLCNHGILERGAKQRMGKAWEGYARIGKTTVSFDLEEFTRVLSYGFHIKSESQHCRSMNQTSLSPTTVEMLCWILMTKHPGGAQDPTKGGWEYETNLHSTNTSFAFYSPSHKGICSKCFPKFLWPLISQHNKCRSRYENPIAFYSLKHFQKCQMGAIVWRNVFFELFFIGICYLCYHVIDFFLIVKKFINI